MKRTTWMLLITSVVCLIAGLLFSLDIIDVSRVPGLYVALPAGTILFGLFLIAKIFEKERDDKAQQRRKLLRKRDEKEIRSPKSERGPKSESRIPKEVRKPNLETNAGTLRLPFRISGFGFLSDFGLRTSDFPLMPFAARAPGRWTFSGARPVPRPSGASSPC